MIWLFVSHILLYFVFFISLFTVAHSYAPPAMPDLNTAEAIAQVEKELSSDEKKDETEGNSLADNVFFNIGFIVIVVAFWLKYFNVV